MADAKATKKAPEVKTLDQLKEELIAKRKDLIEAKRSNAAGELVNPRVITKTKKEIARLLTAIKTAKLEETK
jgi:ribosomal protein L29